MTSYFLLVPYAELTQAMLNLSTSQDKATLPLKTFGGIVSPYYVLEVSRDNLKDVSFANYRPYLPAEIDAAVPVVSKVMRQGIIFDTVNVGQSETTSYTVPSNKIIYGVVFKAFNTTAGDKITLKVFTSQDVEVSTIISGAYVGTDLIEAKVNPTLIPQGYVIKATYDSVGGLNPNPSYFFNVHWRDE